SARPIVHTTHGKPAGMDADRRPNPITPPRDIIMTMHTLNTTDICDTLGDKALPLPPVYRHFGKRATFAGVAVTVKCFEDSSRVKELIAQPGTGKVLVIDGGGSTRCAL